MLHAPRALAAQPKNEYNNRSPPCLWSPGSPPADSGHAAAGWAL